MTEIALFVLGKRDSSHRGTGLMRKRETCRLTDTKASDKPASVDCSETTTMTHKDGNANDPKSTECPSGPKTTDAITNQECAVKHYLLARQQASRIFMS